MENFEIYNPVKVQFGKGCIEKLYKSLKENGSKVLLVYGGGSIKTNGIYDDVIGQIEKSGLDYIEYSGIKPNPRVEDTDEAARMAREFGADLILAVGGGSVIDSGKVISMTIPVAHSGWDFMTGSKKPEKAIPVIAVLTLAATGSEMNCVAVVQNSKTKEKPGFRNPLIYPVESYLDPSYTFTVPRNYTGYGVVDLTAHCLEAFFGDGEATLSDRFALSIIKEGIKYGELLLDDLDNYFLREKIMYAATMALNNLTLYGRKYGDWGVHALGHILSVLYDTPHGATLSIAYPAWLKYNKKRLENRIIEMGRNLFNVKTADESIFELENFFAAMESPIRLKDIGIEESKHQEILNLMLRNNPNGNNIKLSKEDYPALIGLMG
jgi:alcohol dehydrogenase YqhD (iron-dependent ADH family)